MAFEFYDKGDNSVAKVGNKTHDLKQAHHEIYLNDDERIVGYEATR